MSLESDLGEFRDLYHEYEDACEELRAKEESYRAIASVSRREYFATTSDAVVRSASELDGRAQEARAAAQAKADEAQKAYDEADAEASREVSDVLAKRADYQAGLDEAVADARERLDALWAQEEIPPASEPKPHSGMNLSRREVGVIATGAICLASLYVSGAIIGFSGSEVSDVSGGILVLGMAAGFAMGLLLCKSHVAGCLVGIGLAIAEIFAAAAVASMGGVLAVVVVAVFVAGCTLAYWLIRTMDSREDKKQRRTYLERRIKEAEAALSLAEGERDANAGRYDAEVASVQAKAESGRESTFQALELARHNLASAKRVYDDEVVPLLKSAHARSNALLMVDVEKASQELGEAYDAAEQLRDELDAMVAGDEANSLPAEEDWPAIDALYEAVRRGYAETRKEALLFCRQEARYHELMGSLDRQYEESRSLRESVSSQLGKLESQGQRRDALLSGQLGVMRSQLAVAQGSLAAQAAISGQAASLVAQGERAASQRSRMLSQGSEMAAAQHEIAGIAQEQSRQLAEVSAKVDKVTKAVRTNTAVGGLGVLVSDSTRRNVKAIGKTLGL